MTVVPAQRRSSISRRLTWMNMVVSGAGLLLAFSASIAYELWTSRDVTIRNLAIQADIIGSNSVSALTFNDPAAAQTTLQALSDAPHIASAGIYTAEGQLFAGYSRNADAVSLPAPSIPPGETQVARFDGRLMGVARRVTFEGKPIGLVYIRSDLREVYGRLLRYAATAGVILLASLIAALMASRLSQRAISVPIVQLAETVQSVSHNHDYAVRATPSGGADEVRVLEDAFNEMLATIQQHQQELQKAHDHLEERVRMRTQELNTANKELEAFSYSVSHDLRAPLRHITGFSALLEQRAGSTLDDDSRRYLKTIVSASTRMGRLIDDLLAFSRLGRANVTKARVSLRDLVDQARAEVSSQAGDRQVVWRVAPSLPDVHADPNLLQLALVNLLSNALKYTGTRQLAEIDVGIHPNGQDRVVLFVRDNGVGFDMQYAGKLFGVFQRLHGTDEFEGTGIGLANVRRIIRRHGGDVWADAEVDRGATFYLSLPVEG
jgi:signal transduction histidine kinase